MKRFLAVMIALTVIMMSAVTAANAAQEPPAATDEPFAVGASAVSVPKIEITTENGNGASLEKADGYVNAQIRITDTDGSTLSGDVSFKVRGNSTAMTFVDKKGFNFKFAKKTEVLGMGKGKKWALLANCFDPTLLRNYLAFELAYELGLPYASQQRFVELWLDGSYHGCYTVYEPVQEGKDRVDIDIESNEGKKDFLLEVEATRVESDVTYLSVGGVRFAISEPEEPTDDQLSYITDVMTGIMNILKNGTEADIRAAIDVDSFSAYYLLNEYAKTLDFDFSSAFFFYQDGKLYAGPPWDYDLALGNANPDLASTKAKQGSVTDGIMQDKAHLYRFLSGQEWFKQAVRRVYLEHRDFIGNISADGGLLDSLRARYGAVIDRNFEKWKVSRWWLNYQKKPLATYEQNYAFLKNWCAARHAWLSAYYGLDQATAILLGDADNDGKITILDATVIQRELASLPTASFNPDAADIDGNGLNILDATVIQRYLANFAVGYPIGEIVYI